MAGYYVSRDERQSLMYTYITVKIYIRQIAHSMLLFPKKLEICGLTSQVDARLIFFFVVEVHLNGRGVISRYHLTLSPNILQIYIYFSLTEKG